MKLTDEEYYKRKEQQNEHRQNVLKKAKARGKVAKEWLKTNKLTRETKPDFDALMKKSNAEHSQNT